MKNPRLRVLARLALALCGLGIPCAGAWGGVTITECQVDGEPAALQPSGAFRDAELKPLRVSSALNSLRLHFFSQASVPEVGILRYKLEGRDTDWRDLPSGMRVVLRFYGKGWTFIGAKEFSLEGETPQWRGTVKNSEYASLQREAVVPEGAAELRVAFMSGGRDSVVGAMGIDFVQVTVKHRDDPPRTFDFSVTEGYRLVYDDGSPAKWVREGSGTDMAKLKSRVQPARHTMLTLLDDDAQRSVAWTIRPGYGIPVSPGDHVTLRWETAYSIGDSGPGTAEYKRLAPGSYWFRVATFRVNGDQTAIASLPIVVVAPFYHRGEFWGATVAALAGVVTFAGWLLVRRRTRAKIARIEREGALERERARIARDLHDEVGAGLTEIAMQTDCIRRDVAGASNGETQRRADRVCQSAVSLVRSVDEIVWAVNPANDTLDRFVNYLTQYTEQFLDTAGLSLRFDIPPDPPAAVLPGALRHTLFLAVSESLNNVVKHARAEQVRMKVAVEDGWLRIVVEDNGRGFDPAGCMGGGVCEGLKNMRQRMDACGGEFKLTSRIGEGTQVEFALPLKVSPRHPTQVG